MINIRKNVFETNSSSVHSLVICDKDDYLAWVNGEKLLNLYYEEDWAWKRWDPETRRYIETEKGMSPQFVTPEEAAYYDELYPYPKMEEDKWGYSTDFEGKDGEPHERKFLTFEEYNDAIGCHFETFHETHTTPKGEEIMAFGYHGYDG